MKTLSNSLKMAAVLCLLFAYLAACTNKTVNSGTETQAKIDSMQNVLMAIANQKDTLEKTLAKFDTVDFVVFSGQQWARFHESHAKDVIVNWPDGHHTNGLDRHIEDLKAMFVYAPDTRIKVHPIRFGDSKGEWTCVTGIMEGTFTKPMPMGNGQVIQPTGKAFKINMCTVGHWKNGVMTEESLFWDNQTYLKQMGVIK